MKFSCDTRAFLLLRINQPAAHTGKSFLGLLALCHVNARTYVTGKRAFGTKSRYPHIQDPSILSIVPPQPILHFERLTPLEGLVVIVQTQLQIIRVHTLRPSVSQFRDKRPSGELKPRSEERRVGKECKALWSRCQ